MCVYFDLLFFFECYGDTPDLHDLTHSFPTRRSYDLVQAIAVLVGLTESAADGTLTGAEFTDQIVSVFTMQLKSLSGREPVLVVFEDVHWVEIGRAHV